jgi:hypothetical protein
VYKNNQNKLIEYLELYLQILAILKYINPTHALSPKGVAETSQIFKFHQNDLAMGNSAYVTE